MLKVFPQSRARSGCGKKERKFVNAFERSWKQMGMMN